MKISDLDGITERISGLGCMAGAVIEAIHPNILAIDMSQGIGLGVFGFLVATGRASAAVQMVRKALS